MTFYSKNGTWYELSITDCMTWAILRDSQDQEFKFYYDFEGIAEMMEFLG